MGGIPCPTKKKQDDYCDIETFERGVVHTTGIATVVSAKSWVSVASSDDNDELIPICGTTSLTKRDFFILSSLGGTPSPRDRDLEGEARQK